MSVQSKTWTQDGQRIERITARLAGEVDIVDDDAAATTMDATGVLVARYAVWAVDAKRDKRSLELKRKVVLEIDEVRVVHDYQKRKDLLVDLGFEDAGDVIPANATQAALPAGVDEGTGEIDSEQYEDD